MSDLVDDQLEAIDFAVAAFRVEGEWEVQEITRDHLESVTTFAEALRRLPGDTGALGMVAVDEDFFVLVRVTGSQVRVLLSDVTAADEWDLAESVVDLLRLPDPDDDDDPVPVGDLDIVGDLGMDADDMGDLLDDDELFPDEMLSEIAQQLGFGEPFDEAVGLSAV